MPQFPISLTPIPVPVLLADAAGMIVSANPAARALLGEVVGTRLGVVIPVGTWRHADPPAVLDAQVVTLGGERSFRIALSTTMTEGRLLSCVVLAHERDPQRQERLDSLGLVAGGIAHDFNNLLVGVLAEASAAREDRELTEGTRESLRRIEAAARRMAQLTRQLLAFAGRAQIITHPIDADELIGELVEELTRIVRPEVRLTISAGASGAVIEADRSLLRHAIVHLVTNASDVAASNVDIATQIVARDGSSHWQLEVVDDGAGIDASALPRIFEPFFSTKSGHHGLGLSAVHGIVQRLGGDVEVDTQVGRGARFRVRLPIVVGVEPSPSMSREIPTPSSPLVGLHVLVADDEPSVRATVRRLLERRGATVVVAADGTQAEKLLRATPSGFQLVITDVAMPGANGYDVLGLARETQPDVAIILMSGYTEMLRGTGSELVPDAFLEKPFTAKAMDRTVDEVMKGKR